MSDIIKEGRFRIHKNWGWIKAKGKLTLTSDEFIVESKNPQWTYTLKLEGIRTIRLSKGCIHLNRLSLAVNDVEGWFNFFKKTLTAKGFKVRPITYSVSEKD